MPSITDIEPGFGPPGTEIELHGHGFDDSADFTVVFGGASARAERVDDSLLRVVVPNQATTSFLELRQGESRFDSQSRYWVTRNIDVTLANDIVAPGIIVGSAFGDSEVTSSPWSVRVGVGRITLVVAATSPEEPLGLAMAAREDTSVEISPESTALALLFMHPVIYDDRAGGYAAVRQTLLALPGFDPLVEIIRRTLGNGNALTGHPEMDAALSDLVVAYMSRPASEEPPPQVAAQERAEFVSLFGFEEMTPRDLVKTNFELLETSTTIEGRTYVTSEGIPIIGAKLNPNAPAAFRDTPLLKNLTANPLDWKANLYRLDPLGESVNSASKVRALRGDFSRTHERLQNGPISSYIAPAKLVTRYGDPWGIAKELILAKASLGKAVSLLGKNVAPPSQLEIPSRQSGLYMVRAFSGARFDLQHDLLRALPGGAFEDSRMFKLNFLLGIQDFVIINDGFPSICERP